MKTLKSILCCTALLCVGGFIVNQHKCNVEDREGLICKLNGEQHDRMDGDRVLRGLKKIEFLGFIGRMINLTEGYYPDILTVIIESTLPKACDRIWTSPNVTVLVNQHRCNEVKECIIPESVFVLFQLIFTV